PAAEVPGGLPPPNATSAAVAAPEVGLIVRFNGDRGRWEDELGRNFTNAIRFSLPDRDVFRLDALADPPREVAAFAHVGTVLFNMIVDPSTGTLYVSNTEARNEVRFEGHGAGRTTLRGHLHESRITLIDGDAVVSRHLNKHITALPEGYHTAPMPAAVEAASLATPVDMALASDGTLYVAAFGSSKVAVYATAELAADTFVPEAVRHIEVSGGGPAGLALDEAHQRLYVLTRFDNAVKVIDTATGAELAQHRLHNPEPQRVVAGRPFLYDARATSSNGEASCATCHVFGDVDSLAWDLGNPDGDVVPMFNPLGPTGLRPPFHPMKGPMTSQTLRGMRHQGPMHWRGDRTGSQFVGDPRAYDTDLAFKAFNAAFDELLGRDEGELSDEDMQAFTDFALEIQPPPNPVRSLDNQLTAAQASGRQLFLNRDAITDSAAHCAGCHTLDARDGQFGTLGQTTFDDQPQQFKVPQLKNAYQKIGMFGMPSVHVAQVRPEDAAFQGEQIRGFGFLHDGSVATVFDFLRGSIFRLDDTQRDGLEEFVLAFDTTFAPIVGQQITLTADNGAVAGPRIDLMIARARSNFALIDQPGARECDLVARALVGGQARGFLLDAVSGEYRSDRESEATISDTQLRALAAGPGATVTYTCAPPGEGIRVGLDRDSDELFDRDEIDLGSDPADPRDPGRATRTPSPTSTATPIRTNTPTFSPFVAGDMNCDGLLDEADPPAAAETIFNLRLRPRCDTDCNTDGEITAADVTCVEALLIALPR
ncbi:MAG: YncE family protein, partial [Candidatus Binatia bacterium]